ncbi:MAG: hypothetical protein CMI52_00745 [Parcubacteria group bacterium]|nr:hypothetical protein [Parcubacteria group bacterium]|tara:strand:- start:1675 stop:1941 length:267 start_codon:yes stop_codon:yes gene_type:complete
MPEITFDVCECVWITVSGELKGQPLVREDDGLCDRLSVWLKEQHISRVVALRKFNRIPGTFDGFYAAEDAKKIFTWLEQNSASRKATG